MHFSPIEDIAQTICVVPGIVFSPWKGGPYEAPWVARLGFFLRLGAPIGVHGGASIRRGRLWHVRRILICTLDATRVRRHALKTK